MIHYHFSAKTDVGLVRKANEDNLGNAQTPNGHVFIVCDGMGGHVGGARASQIAVNSILEFFMKQEYENMFTALDRSLQFANEQIYAVSMAEPELKGMGTTAVILVVKDDSCFIGYVGDSRIYLKSGNKLNRLTKDHSFVQTLVDSGLITDEQAENHPQKNQILKALGISPIIEPTIAQVPILPAASDVFLLCSDGMSGMVNDESMEMMIDGDDLNRSAAVLIQAANDSGGHDNITVTLVGILNSPHTHSTFKHYNPVSANKFSTTDVIASKGNSTLAPFLANKYIYIVVFLVLAILGLGWWLFMSDANSESGEKPSSDEKIREESLSNRTLEDLYYIKDQGNIILSQKDTIEGTQCDCKIVIVNKKIAKIIESKKSQKEVVSVPEKDKKKQGEEPVSAPDSDLKSDCGNEIIHVIKSGDGFGKLEMKYKPKCDSITADYLKSKYNQKVLKTGDTLRFNCLCKKIK